jgi:hypothetical protein
MLKAAINAGGAMYQLPRLSVPKNTFEVRRRAVIEVYRN